jgi:site-specific recombinase XerD
MYFALKERIEEKYWTGKVNRWVKENHPHAFELNTLIKKRLDILGKYEYRQKVFGNGISPQGIIEYYHKKADPNVFNEFVDEFMQKSLKGRALATIKKYKTFVKYLHEFNPRLSFSQLNEDLFQSFAIWLGKKGMLGVTIEKYFDPFKVIVKQAVKEGYLEKDPFLYSKLEIKLTRSKRIYLELEEITKIRNAKLPTDRDDLENVRKHWLFCFYAGFYYSDLKALTWQNVKNTDHGYCIMGSRYKNENDYIAPIHKFPNAIEIIKLQQGKDPELVFPEAISEQKYNAKLKELAAAAGIEKKLMNKTARHSAIQFWEAQGLETQHTAKMVGHTKESTTKEYYNLSSRDINNRVSKFDFTDFDV